MIEIYVFTAIALIATGVVLGIVVVVSLGVRREGRGLPGALPTDAGDRVTRGARRLTGLYVRRPSPVADADRRRRENLPV